PRLDVVARQRSGGAGAPPQAASGCPARRPWRHLQKLSPAGRGRCARLRARGPRRGAAATARELGYSQGSLGAGPSLAGPRNISPFWIVNEVPIAGRPSGPALASIASPIPA